MVVAEQEFLDALGDLSEKSGAAGLGLQTTKYLAQRGCTVYAASRNEEKSVRGIAEAEASLPDSHGPINFHHLDLSTVQGARRSAEAFLQLQDRLDVLVANAGVSMLAQDKLSHDGYERMFATNHLGHFVFITTLLDLMKRTSTSHGHVRIVVTSSVGYRNATGLDYSALTQARPGDGESVWDVLSAFGRYGNSKLANIYFTLELDRRLREDGYTNMYCNSCHPGFAGATGLGAGGFVPWGKWAESLVRLLMKPLNSVEDACKTQTYLAASPQIPQQDVRGQYWAPVWSWTQRYLGCGVEPLTELARNEDKQKELWAFSERAMEKGLKGEQ
ncbi:MAG: hypothetical protein Q9168_001334 [Polycauliona sp. 1 TL-2023]